jgi:hypothetical protein
MIATSRMITQPAPESTDEWVESLRSARKVVVMGPVYPSFIAEALRHAERLTAVLESLDPRTRGVSASTWLLGRASEVDCVLQLVISDWRAGRTSEVHTARAINSYLAALHRGLALYFGELAPPCCISSLVITATAASFDSSTRRFPRAASPKWHSANATWTDVDDSDILSVSYGTPSTLRRR